MFYRFKHPLALASLFRANVPIVCFQSDDWGQITFRDKITFERYLDRFDERAGERWLTDSVETEDDLALLATVLGKHADSTGTNPVFTLNYIVSAPDFDHIEHDNLDSYRTTDISKLVGCVDLALELSKRDLFDLQLHGGEHFNPMLWLSLLKHDAPRIRWCFERRIVPPANIIGSEAGLGAAYLRASAVPGEDFAGCSIPERLGDAVNHFIETFETIPDSFVAPNHCWDVTTEETLIRLGISNLQAANIQYTCVKDYIEGRYEKHVTGIRSAIGMTYLGRNISFEPARFGYQAHRVLEQIEELMVRRIPVVISTHRVNYVGAIDEKARQHSVAELDQLLTWLRAEFPEVRYVKAKQLFELSRDGRASGKHGVGILRGPVSAQYISLFKDIVAASLKTR
jgi:hypothetical protein